MKKLLKFIFYFLITLKISSQEITLSGFVKDSLQNPLPYANVLAKPKDVSKNLKFAITDEEGYYKLKLKKGDTLTVNISYIGYITNNFEFIASKNTKKDFILQQSSEQLDEIIIEMPVMIKGDTTTYKTEKFVDGSERKLKNVLKKLPGVEVDKKGNVTVQGKKITQMLVDGKKFFGGNSKLAVENIPADAVGNVEVIDNYNEIAFLKNVSDSDEMAMNIKLKEDKKQFIFGDVETGKGNQDFYKTNANLFYYSPKTNINFIGNTNNINEKTFTFKDYLNFSGGVNAVFKGNFDFTGQDFSQFLESADLQSSKQNFGALNITKTTNSKLDISGYAIFSNTNTSSFIENLNEYTNFNEEKTNKTDADNLLGIGNFNIEYTPNNLEKWHIKTQFKRTNNYSQNAITSLINTNTNTITTDRNLKSTYINQNIEWHKRQSSKHTFSTVLNYVYNKNNRNHFWQTKDPIFNNLIPIEKEQETFKINQIKNTKKQNIDAVFKHFWELNNNNHIYTTLGNMFLNESFLTKESQELDNGNINNFSISEFGNDLNFKLNDLFLGIHYKFRTGIFTFKQGFYAHNYHWKTNQQTNLSKNKWVVLPDFLAKIEFTKSKKIQFNYNLKTSFSDASKFANRFYLQSYNSVFRGNENLENNLFHNARIYYRKFSLYRGVLLNASLNYTKQIRGIRNVVNFDNINQFLTVKLFNNPSESINGNIRLEKRIKEIKYKFNVGFNNSIYKQEINNSIQINKNNNYNYKVGIETLFDNFPTLEIGLKREIGKFISSNNNSKFATLEPFVSIDYDFLKGFIFNFDYSRSNYQNKTLGQKNIYEIANGTLSYKKQDSAWSYKIIAQNIFNTKFRQSNSFTDYLISDTKTYILPRVFMFSIGYNL
ncbi:carboxypeptidase-like regulatory domain-containing protein [Polaribacter batillariae]|uniref:Carboxypeptidase-like regulatory domain-containing protein n=1 Tax=Polaribacter batillariae TaxID=2808900 RepID=A0ABX7SPX7_9FLAO|nr:carboxypeptidase-like regulatory domain-containing protein [Polaribacter batillariae]QTD36275.1 carboxypeptidase-like regulatory domain-containing protein [Polaribacter batillariae]